jgi:hypothetical protein
MNVMKKLNTSLIVLIASIMLIMILLAGCKILPASPASEPALAAPEAQETQIRQTTEQPIPQTGEQTAAQPSEGVAIVSNSSSESNTTVTETTELKISGSLKLQNDLSLCQHLSKEFTCDRYDPRGCDFTKLMSDNEYYPSVLNCRDGLTSKKENPAYKYCLLQECKPLTEGNIVYSYGGPTEFAEYAYTKEKTETGIIFNYVLKRCGEQQKEFADINKCKYYRTDSGLMN